MSKFIFLLLLSVIYIQAKDFKQPIDSFISSGFVVDLVYKDSKIYSATDAGIVDVFDFNNKKLVKKIKLPKIEDFMGEEVDSKVYSVDELDGVIMILSQSKKGFSRLHIHKNNKTSLIIDYIKNLSIIKAKYLNKNTVILALISNEIISYNINKAKQNYRYQVSGAKFSDFALSEDKTKIAVADESGVVQIYDTLSAKNIKKLKGQNVDNIFQIAYKNDIVVTAGQDRRVGVYSLKFNSAYHIKSTFLVYSVGLSPSGKIAAYSSNENNNVTLFNTATKSKIGEYSGNKMTLSNIVFINDEEFLVSSNNQIINLYSVK
ncbi:WD40 repeat domain-containing protein [Sulfurimonas sp.]|uniref:WD40 repeat domain-containing protein n=1 Tax=Sulfurimonas sp. TaxID=2022749 RepID=UPI0026344F16|nr:WD40 repeat domain-containing protein [Sulfurimonas sp.]MCW8895267.1 WD40 repeat domain-containing protein [Sulfurimonas sp.]